MRAETGPLKFGDDWTGVFIRGDVAMLFLQNLRILATLDEVKSNVYLKSSVESLADLMASSHEHASAISRQHLKEFSDCLISPQSLNREDQIDQIEDSNVES